MSIRCLDSLGSGRSGRSWKANASTIRNKTVGCLTAITLFGTLAGATTSPNFKYFLASWRADLWAVAEYVCIYGVNIAIVVSCYEFLKGFRAGLSVGPSVAVAGQRVTFGEPGKERR